MWKRAGIVAEVGLVLGLFLIMRVALRDTLFATWQESAFGAAILSSSLLFFALPLAVMLVTGRHRRAFGLTVNDLRYHMSMGARAGGFLLPATFAFPLVAMLGMQHKGWSGALLLTAAFGAAGLLALRRLTKSGNGTEDPIPPAGLLVYFVLLAAGALISFLTHPVSTILTRVVQVLIFVGFLEEFFFRGYVQSRLNDLFGRPYSIFEIRFGAGLVLSALLFGLFHPITSREGTPWPWALWTCVVGLTFGFLREKSGTAVAPAVAHGLILLPMVLFAP